MPGTIFRHRDQGGVDEETLQGRAKSGGLKTTQDLAKNRNVRLNRRLRKKRKRIIRKKIGERKETGEKDRGAKGKKKYSSNSIITKRQR